MWVSEWYTVGSHRNMMRTKRVDTCKRTHRVHQTCKNTPKQRHTFRNSECEKYHRKQETTHQRGRRRRTAWGLGRWHSHRWNDTNRRRRLSFTFTRTSCVDAVVWVETSPNRLEKKNRWSTLWCHFEPTSLRGRCWDETSRVTLNDLHHKLGGVGVGNFAHW